MGEEVRAIGRGAPPGRRRTKAAVISELKAELAGGRLAGTRAVPPGLVGLLGGGGLRRGASYVVSGSTSLALALLSETSRSGGWCAAVGMPGLGAEAAAGFGVALDRLALVPAPGREWLTVVGTLVDALDVVLVRPPAAVADGDARRLAARLRERGATLLVADAIGGRWPGAELRLSVGATTWHGLGAGYGHLTAREVVVEVSGRSTGGRARGFRLWLPDGDGAVRPVESLATTGDAPERRLRQVG